MFAASLNWFDKPTQKKNRSTESILPDFSNNLRSLFAIFFADTSTDMEEQPASKDDVDGDGKYTVYPRLNHWLI